MKTTFRVVDAETGLAVTNAVVQKSFRISDSEDKQIKSRVDNNGYCTLSGESISYSGGGARVLADGYYDSSVGYKFKKRNHILNRWEPWNPTVEVKMRPKKNPVSKVFRILENELIPIYEQPVGFDLEKGDWVAPYGKGKTSDFVFKAELVTDPKEGIRYSLSFSNELDGIQEYVPTRDISSSFIFPYQAPINKFNMSLQKYRLLKYPEGSPSNTGARAISDC